MVHMDNNTLKALITFLRFERNLHEEDGGCLWNMLMIKMMRKMPDLTTQTLLNHGCVSSWMGNSWITRLCPCMQRTHLVNRFHASIVGFFPCAQQVRSQQTRAFE